MNGASFYDTTTRRLAEKQAFERLFAEHFPELHRYAFVLVKDQHRAEEAVQQVFVNLWQRWPRKEVKEWRAYLYTCVYNECLAQQKRTRKSLNHKHSESVPQLPATLEHKEVDQRLLAALQRLPQQCGLIFQLHRFQGMRYKDIAGQLGISPKTVENQMSKAIKLLHASLNDLLKLLIMILWH